MRKFEHVVKSPVGLHPRVGGQLMYLIRDFDSDVILLNREGRINMQKVMGTRHMDIRSGDCLRFEITGKDEDVAMQELEAFVEYNL